MANLFIIKRLLNERKISIRDFARRIDITENGLQKIIQKGNTSTDWIEKIAKELSVPVGIFFNEESGCNPVSTEERLLSVTESQQSTIESLSKVIESLTVRQE